MSSPLEYVPLVIGLVEGRTVLDVGCGRGNWGYLLRVNWWCTKDRSGSQRTEYIVGVDIFLPFLRARKTKES